MSAGRVLRGLLAAAAVLAGAAGGLIGVCGPFTDTANDGFCPFVLEIFTLNITTGTTATTFSPADNVTRLQMAAFLSRTVDRTLQRGSRRASLDQFWKTQTLHDEALIALGSSPGFVKSDGADLWISDQTDDLITRIRGSDGKFLQNWISSVNPSGLLVAIGRIFAAGNLSPGRLYMIDPGQNAGAVTTVATTLGAFPQALVFDGVKIWSGDFSGSVSIVTPGSVAPWTVATVTTGFDAVAGMVFDGTSVWAVDTNADRLFKLDSSGGILQTVTVGNVPGFPVFDGNNIWVPNVLDPSITVVRASNGAILATLTGNGLGGPYQAAFDGERVLVTNQSLGSVSLWKAADLSPLGFVSTGGGTQPHGACSDGVHFWVVLNGSGSLARF
ncbi:MAG TPA: S-layer homology domain-containing protein [Thermoanaerobaculia bacterium]|nr:S-layer homology domain-containing protein [Thermoanaerobaculia bacterium]